MNYFNTHVSIIDKFTRNFKGQFSKTQLVAFTALLYALINEYKRVNISSLANALGADYLF
jgi:hypothetical protein